MMLDQLMREIDAFAVERDWERFHTPKNLAMSVAIEAGELLEVFQWLTPEESAALADEVSGRSQVVGEIADVLIYLLRLCSVLGVDPLVAAGAKLEANRSREWPR